MKRFSTIMSLVLHIGLVSAVFFSMLVRTVKAQSITGGNTQNTQVSLFCTVINTINSNGRAPCATWNAIQPDGTFTSYSIPSGQTLIITDIECTTVVAAGDNGECWLYNPATVASFGFITNLQAGALSGPHGTAIIALHLTTGIQFTVLPGMAINGTPQQMTMQGYLIPTPPAAAGS